MAYYVTFLGLAETIPTYHEPDLAGVETLVLLVVSIALSVAANLLLKPENKNVLRDDKPTTLTSRGSFVPYFVGKRRVGPFFAWAGDRRRDREKAEGGKGGSVGDSEVHVYYESGWHILCVGPASRLFKITSQGAAIFQGPIDPASHPSGSVIDLGRDGQFAIYWGDGGQPINTELGTPERVGVSSRWPFHCYIHWIQRRLGTSANWPLIDYDVECKPFDSRLRDTPAWIEATKFPGGVQDAVLQAGNGLPGTGFFTVDGKQTDRYHNGALFRLSGNAAPDQDFRVLFSERVTGVWDGYRTNVYPDDSVISVDASGTLELYQVDENDGANPAHVMDQLLFSEKPHGLARDRSLYDIDSLEALGRLCAEERLPISFFAQGGEEAMAIMASIMQDIGFFQTLDPHTGLIKFVPIRDPSGTSIPHLPSTIIVPPLPEQTNYIEALPADRLVFKFQARIHNFRDVTISVGDDAQALEEGHSKVRSVDIRNATDYVTASKISERRGQEDLAGANRVRFKASREARRLIPGAAFTLAGFPYVLRCFSVKANPLEEAVEIDSIVDAYGAEASDFEHDTAKEPTPPAVAEPDDDFHLAEVPAFLLNGVKTQVAIMPRIRDNERISRALLYLSADDITYTQVGEELDLQTGGTLDETLSSDGLTLMTTGFTFTADGPDIGIVEDLTGDDTNWRLGRQLAYFPGTQEWMFIQNIVSLGGTSYRADGVIRARYDSLRGDHAVGDRFYIFLRNGVKPIQDPLLAPGATIFYKTQPIAANAVPLSEIDAKSIVLEGKGVTPMPIANLRTNNQANFHENGVDVVLEWSYRQAVSPRTGAGLFAAGQPVSASPPEGSFEIIIKNIVGGELNRYSSATNTFTYTAAQKTADGTAAVDFKVEVRNVVGGYVGDSREITVELL